MPLLVTKEGKSAHLHSGCTLPVTGGFFSLICCHLQDKSSRLFSQISLSLPHRGGLFTAQFLLISFPRKKQSPRAC